MSNQDSILVYKEDVWNTADILRGVSITGSDFPKYMMPMFAILMIESRIVRKIREYEEEFGSREEAVKEYRQEIKEAIENGMSYYGSNEVLLDTGKTLFDICQNDQGFDSLLNKYLESYDEETKDLLGITGGALNNLGFSAYLEALDKKEVKFQYTKAWSTIDLSNFNNSEITTLEEHIKRKWADISAATAGEHYTPYDVTALNTALAYAYYKEFGILNSNLNIYDPTCGGGNMLFGVEDNFNQKLHEDSIVDKPYISTFGQEYEKSLYALAKIESRFRDSSNIKYGNTLTNDKHAGTSMNITTANPPYGVDWKQEYNFIVADLTGRFHHYPSVGDGQLLFLQHIISKMTDDKGQLSVAFVVLNGSPLFSGDAGSGESECRKWLLENDYVEALIQLPTGEFFNTNITTYVWVINKNKKASRKDIIRLVNASAMGQKLKKSKGKKVNELSKTATQEIVEMVMNDDIEDENVQDFHKDFFHYNKQQLELTETDINGKAFIPPMKNDKPQKVILPVTRLDFNVTELGAEIQANEDELDLKVKAKNQAKLYNDNIDKLIVRTNDGDYCFNDERQTIVKTFNGVDTDLGCGVIKVKCAYKKATAKDNEHIATTVELTTKTEKDNEIIEYSSDAIKNKELTQSFLDKWVERDYVMLDNKVGVEINFNKIFYKPEVLRPIDDIKTDLEASNAVLVGLMGDIFND